MNPMAPLIDNEGFDWKKFALVEPIDKVIFVPGICEFMLATAEESKNTNFKVESGGFVYGTLYDGIYYALNEHRYLDQLGNIQIESPIPKPSLEYIKSYSSKDSNFRTVSFHSHPRVSFEDIEIKYRERIRRQLRREITRGVFDYLVDSGRPSIEDVLNELVTRDLSQEDISFTAGNYHLLISPTPHKDMPNSHINFFHIGPDRVVDKKVSVERMSYNHAKRMYPILRKYSETYKKVFKELFGFEPGDEFKKDVPLEKIQRMAEYYMSEERRLIKFRQFTLKKPLHELIEVVKEIEDREIRENLERIIIENRTNNPIITAQLIKRALNNAGII